MLNRMSVHPNDAAGRYELTGMTGSMCYMVRVGVSVSSASTLTQAPEVYNGARYNEKVDIYSLGVIMYELCSRILLKVYLKDVEHMQQFARSICQDGYRCVLAVARRVTNLNALYRPSLPASMPEQVKKIIEACWAADPAKRPSAQQVHDMLCDVQASGVLDGRMQRSSVLGRWLRKCRGKQT